MCRPCVPPHPTEQSQVYLTPYTELADEQTATIGKGALTKNSFGQLIHTKVYRWIVVKEGDHSCTSVRITSYSGQGVAKQGVKKADHVVVFLGQQPPPDVAAERPRSDEAPMQPYPIRIDPDHTQEARLDFMSRLDLGKPMTIQHYAKVKSFGKVNRAYLGHLTTQYRNVAIMSDPRRAIAAKNQVSSAPSAASTAATDRSITGLMRRAARDLNAAGWSKDEISMVLRTEAHPNTQRGRSEKSAEDDDEEEEDDE